MDLDRLLRPIFSRMILLKKIKAIFRASSILCEGILRCYRCNDGHESTDRVWKQLLRVWLSLPKVNSVTVQPRHLGLVSWEGS